MLEFVNYYRGFVCVGKLVVVVCFDRREFQFECQRVQNVVVARGNIGVQHLETNVLLTMGT